MPWADITKKEEFQGLSPDEKEAIKTAYYQKRVSPQVAKAGLAEDEQQAVFQAWMSTPDDSGQGYATSALSSMGRGFASVVPGVVGGAGALVGSKGLQRTADEIEQGIEEFLPVNPIYEDRLDMKAFGAAGQALSMLPTAGLGGAVGKALGGARAINAGAQSTALGSGFLSGARGGAKEAERYGMEGGRAYLRTLLGGGTELATEKLLFGMGTETDAIRKLLGGSLDKGAGGFAKAVGTEAGEEGVAQAAGNMATMALAPAGVETPDVLTGVGEAAFLGGVGGGVFGGVNALTGTEREVVPNIESGELALPKELREETLTTTVAGVGEVQHPENVSPELVQSMSTEELNTWAAKGQVTIKPAPPPVDPAEKVVQEAAATVQANAEVAPMTAVALNEALAPTAESVTPPPIEEALPPPETPPVEPVPAMPAAEAPAEVTPTIEPEQTDERAEQPEPTGDAENIVSGVDAIPDNGASPAVDNEGVSERKGEDIPAREPSATPTVGASVSFMQEGKPVEGVVNAFSPDGQIAYVTTDKAKRQPVRVKNLTAIQSPQPSSGAEQVGEAIVPASPRSMATGKYKPSTTYVWGPNWKGANRVEESHDFQHTATTGDEFLSELKRMGFGGFIPHAIVGTDANGKPAWVVPPNMSKVVAYGTPEAAYILGDVDAFSKDRARRLKEAGDDPAKREAIVREEIDDLKKKLIKIGGGGKYSLEDAVARQKQGESIKDYDKRFDSWEEYIRYVTVTRNHILKQNAETQTKIDALTGLLPKEITPPEQVAAEGKKKPKKAQRLGRNPAGKDILDYLQENKIAVPPPDQRVGKGEYDWLKTISPYYRQFIIKQVPNTANVATPDTRAQEAYNENQNLVSAPNANALQEAIADAIAGRSQTRAQIVRQKRYEKHAEKQHRDFEKARVDGGERLNMDDLYEGDVVVLNGEHMKVVNVDHDDEGRVTSVRLQDGTMFGIQEVNADQVVLVDEVIPAERDDTASDFAPTDDSEDLTLAPPESSDEMDVRLAKDAKRRADEAKKQQLKDQWSTPRKGTAGEFGTPDMLDNTAGDMALFSQPQPTTPPLPNNIASASVGRPTPAYADDKKYLAAVEAGDMETAQKMVDQAAKEARYDRKLYHGTNATETIDGETSQGAADAIQKLKDLAARVGLNEWRGVTSLYQRLADNGQMGVTQDDAANAKMWQQEADAAYSYTPSRENLAFTVFQPASGELELGVHLGNESAASMFGEVFPFHVKLGKSFRLPDLGTWNYQSVMRELRKRGVKISEPEYTDVFNAQDNNAALRNLLKSKGIASIVYRNEAEGDGDSFIVFDPEQIKSADPVTRDESGEVIPLSKRFDKGSDDIRYSKSGSQPTGKLTPESAKKALSERLGLTNFANIVFGEWSPKGNVSVRGFILTDSNKIHLNLAAIGNAEELVDVFNEEAAHLTFTDPKVAAEWARLKELVPQEQLDKLRAKFESLGYAEEVWDEEAFNESARTNGFEWMNRSDFRKLWDAIKAAVRRIFGLTDNQEIDRLSAAITAYAIENQQSMAEETGATGVEPRTAASPFRESRADNQQNDDDANRNRAAAQRTGISPQERSAFIEAGRIRWWATTGNDVAGRQRELRAFADRYLRRFYGSPASHPVFGSVLSLTDTTLQARPTEDGRIQLGLRVTEAPAIVGNQSSEAATKQLIADAIDEEMVHVADMLAMRAVWVNSGKRGSFRDYLFDRSNALLDSLLQAHDAASDVDKMAIEEALTASMDAYEQKPSGMTFEQRIGQLMSDPQKAYSVPFELVRHLIQAHRNGELTETGWRRVLGILRDWIKGALEALKLVYQNAHQGKMGALLKSRIEQTEAMLAELQQAPDGEITIEQGTADDGSGIRAATPDVMTGEPEPGKRFSEFTERTAVDERLTQEGRDLPPKQFDTTTQQGTMDKAREFIKSKGSRQAALLALQGEAHGLDFEVQEAALLQLFLQFDGLANLENSSGNEAGTQEFDDYADLAMQARDKVAEIANKLGRGMNILNAYMRMSPEGQLRRFERTLEKVRAEKAQTLFGVEYEKLKKELAKAKKQLAEALKGIEPSDLQKLRRKAKATGVSSDAQKAINDVLNALRQKRIDTKAQIERLFPQAGMRDEMNKRGEELVRNFFQMMAGPRPQEGALTEFDKSIQQALSQMLRKVMTEQGLVNDNESLQIKDIDRLVRSVSGDPLRFDKIRAADAKMQSELDAIEDPERRETLRQAWEEATAKMASNIGGESVIRRVINDNLKTAKADFNTLFDTGKPRAEAVKALRDKTVADVMAQLESKLTDPADSTVQRNVEMLRDEVGAAFDQIRDVKFGQWLANRERIARQNEVNERKKDFIAALRNKGVADRVLDRLATAMSDTPDNGKPKVINPVQKLLDEHIEAPVDDFVAKLAELGIPSVDGEILNKVITENRRRGEMAAREKALQDAISALKPKTKKAKAKLSKLLTAIMSNAESGTLERTEFAAALSEALDIPMMTPEFRREITAMVRQINKLPENSAARQQKAVEMNNKLALFKGIPAMEAIMSMWYANILSGLATQAVNIYGNGAILALRTIAVTLGSGRLSEARAMFRGLSEGLPEGIRRAKEVWRTGVLHKANKMDDMQVFGATQLLQDLPTKNFGQWIAYLGSLGGYTAYAFRAMLAVDAVFRYSAYEGRAHLSAARAAREAGFKPGTAEFNAEFVQNLGDIQSVEDRIATAREEFAKAGVVPPMSMLMDRAYEIGLASRPKAIQDASSLFADRTVSQQTPEGVGHLVTQLIGALQKFKPYGVPVFVPLVPFNRIVSNLFEGSLDFAGVGILRGILGRHLTAGKDGRQFDQLERQERFMAGVMGMTVAGLALALSQAFDDEDDETAKVRIWAFGPRDKAAREKWAASGARPFTMKLGDYYWNYAETPLGMLLAAVGGWEDANRYNKGLAKKSTGDRAFYALLQGLQGFSSQGVLSSLGKTIDVLTGDVTPKEAMKIPAQTAAGFLPAQGLLRDVSTLFDDTKIDDSTFYAAMVKDIPVLKSEGTRPSLNIFGDPVKIAGMPVIRRFVTGQTLDPAYSFIGRNGLNIPGLDQTIEIGTYLHGSQRDAAKRRALQLQAIENGVMTSDQRYQFVKRSGELTKRAVEAMAVQTKGVIPPERLEAAQTQLNKRIAEARKQAMLEIVRSIR